MGEHLPAVTGRISKFKEGHLKTTNPCLATAVRPSTLLSIGTNYITEPG